MITTNAAQSLMDYIYSLDNKKELNMIDTFWLMHGNFSNVAKRPINFQTLINQATTRYEEEFTKETSNFINKILDDIYDHIDEYTAESRYYPNSSIILTILKDIIEQIKKWESAYSIYTKEFASILTEMNKYEIAWSISRENNINNEKFQFTNFSKIKKIIENKVHLNTPYENPDLYRRQKEGKSQNNKTIPRLESANKKWLSDQYEAISYKTHDIFTATDNEFIKARSLLNDKSQRTINLLIQIEYALSDIIAYELLTIYMFTNHDISNACNTSVLCHKQEAFFQKIYDMIIDHKSGIAELFNCFFHQARKNAAGIYYPISPEFQAPITFFQLYKIIILYKSLIHDMDFDNNNLSNQIKNNPSVTKTLNLYHKILQQSTLVYPCYENIASEPAIKIMTDLSLTQKEVANYLGITTRVFNSKLRKGTLTSDHPWFWLIISGATYEFLDGLTSLQWYGKKVTDNNDTSFYTSPVLIGSYAENILNRIQSFAKYNRNLGYDKGSPKIQLQSLPHQIEISSRMLKIADLIYRIKNQIEPELESKRMNIIANYKDNPPPNVPREKIGSPISNNYKELISILDDTIKSLKKLADEKG